MSLHAPTHEQRGRRLRAAVAALACTAAIAGLGAGGLVLGGDGEQTGLAPTSALIVPRSGGSATASVPGNLEGVEAVLVNTEPLAGDATTPTSAPVLVATLT